MKKTTIHIDPMSFGRAIALTNLIFAVFAIAIYALTPSVDMKSADFALIMATPFIFAAAGFVYGNIGGTIYNMAAKKKGIAPALEVQEESR